MYSFSINCQLRRYIAENAIKHGSNSRAENRNRVFEVVSPVTVLRMMILNASMHVYAVSICFAEALNLRLSSLLSAFFIKPHSLRGPSLIQKEMK